MLGLAVLLVGLATSFGAAVLAFAPLWAASFCSNSAILAFILASSFEISSFDNRSLFAGVPTAAGMGGDDCVVGAALEEVEPGCVCPYAATVKNSTGAASQKLRERLDAPVASDEWVWPNGCTERLPAIFSAFFADAKPR